MDDMTAPQKWNQNILIQICKTTNPPRIVFDTSDKWEMIHSEEGLQSLETAVCVVTLAVRRGRQQFCISGYSAEMFKTFISVVRSFTDPEECAGEVSGRQQRATDFLWTSSPESFAFKPSSYQDQSQLYASAAGKPASPLIYNTSIPHCTALQCTRGSSVCWMLGSAVQGVLEVHLQQCTV